MVEPVIVAVPWPASWMPAPAIVTLPSMMVSLMRVLLPLA